MPGIAHILKPDRHIVGGALQGYTKSRIQFRQLESIEAGNTAGLVKLEKAQIRFYRGSST